MLSPRVAVVVMVVVLVPAVSAQDNRQITAYSDASYPQEWRLLNDYWFNATSFLNDTRTFHVRMTIPSAGDYVWTIPESGGLDPALPNPLAHLFSTLLLARPGNSTTWDLARTNTTPRFHADGANDVVFTFTYRIRNLTPYEYSSIIDQTIQVRNAERQRWPTGNIVTHANEASGFIRLQQVSSDRQPGSCSETCAGFTDLVARDFNFVFNLAGHPFQLLFRQIQEIAIETPDPSTYLVTGSSYTANAAFDATITAYGNLTGRAVEVLLDDPIHPTATIRLDPTHQAVRTKLPEGDHRFYYRIHLAQENEALDGAITIRSPRSATSVVDAIHVTPPMQPDPSWLLWIIAAALAILFLALAARRRRYTWYEYQRGQLYLVVDRKGSKPAREHRGRAPFLARIRQPRQAG